ncbi:helix-turn-helix domain-containing protein [Streptomyces sp. NPDC050315]|uniref:helix-turn-helix domain-containing protein n=1 Tax=Streptomyces sp. NPDC050315 TaxID=3155039 RepID=UPI00343833A3
MTRNAATELGDFFKARRAELRPREVGLAEGTSRRVPGLRREEVARLAAISTDYYTRLEQGRLQASAAVLDAIARVLQLNDDQRSYVASLAGKDIGGPREGVEQTVQPQLQRLLDALPSIPAMVLGRHMDVLAWNPLAAALVGDFGKLSLRDRNYAKMVFSDRMKDLYADWETTARMTVAHLRMEAARNTDDPGLSDLVGQLSESDADFRHWWNAHHVEARTVGTKTLHHPVAGTLVLDWETYICSTDPDQQLVVWTAKPGSPTHDGLLALASWAADSRQSLSGPTS